MKIFHRPGVEKIARRTSAAALSSSLVLAAVALLVGQCGAARPRPATQPGQISAAKAETTSRHATKTLASLPDAAQSAISASIGRNQSSYRARAIPGGFRTYSHPDTPAAEFTRSGVRIQAGKANFGMAVEDIGRGNALAAVQSAEPQAKANRVEYRRGALTEWYENGPLGLEQGFNVAKAPASSASEAGKPLTIALALTGDLSASLDSGGTSLTLRRPDGQAVLRYTGLVAHDAAGHHLQAWLKLKGSRVSIQVNDADARYPITVDPFLQVAKLTASDGEADDELGYSVATSGDGSTIVVGAFEAPNEAGTGAVYVFVKPTEGWASGTETAELTASDGQSGDFFGYSVAISADGGTIVVGAPQALAKDGAVYVFVKPTTGPWVSTDVYDAELTYSGGGELGTSLAISGDTIVAGAPYAQATTGSTNAGAAAVFVEPQSGGWGAASGTETAELTASDGQSGDFFGYSVAISADGSTIVAGAPDAAIGSNQYQRAAYVFVEPTTGGWASETETAKLTASDGASNEYLGSSVAIGGNTIVAGAPYETVGSNDEQGAAYVFVEPGSGGWATTSAYDAKLTASDGASYDNFGISVSITGDDGTIVVGAPFAYEDEQGGAYVFLKPATGGWTTTSAYDQKFTSLDGQFFDWFGYSVAISGDGSMIVAGSPQNQVGTNSEQGAAYVYVPGTPVAPTITSSDNVAFSVGTPGTFMVAATGTPTPSITETGTLPAGVTFTDNYDGTATIAGTPDAGTAATYNLTITASNGFSPDAMQDFTLTVNANQAPTITSETSTTFYLDTGGTFIVNATGNPTPTNISESGTLPRGVTFTNNDNGTATIAVVGTLKRNALGVYDLTITANNGISPDATQDFTLTVSLPQEAPAITSKNAATFTEGKASSFTVKATGSPTPALSYSPVGTLPAGVTFTDNGDGTATIAGTPGSGSAANSPYSIIITAGNGVGSNATQDFTLTVNPPHGGGRR